MHKMKFKVGDRIRRPGTTHEFCITYVDMDNRVYGLKGCSTDFKKDYLEMAFELVEPVKKPMHVGEWVTLGFNGVEEFDTKDAACRASANGLVYKVVGKVVRKVVTTEVWEQVK